jgi:hypothetical protein
MSDRIGAGRRLQLGALFVALTCTPVTFTHTTVTFHSPGTSKWRFSSQAATNANIITPPAPQKLRFAMLPNLNCVDSQLLTRSPLGERDEA